MCQGGTSAISDKLFTEFVRVLAGELVVNEARSSNFTDRSLQ